MPLYEQQVAIFQHREVRRFTGAGARIEIDLRDAAPKRSGELSRSIMVTRVAQGFVWRYSINVTVPQGKWTNDGTGIYGPVGARITPKVAKLLAWTDGGISHFAKSIAGTPATHWFDDVVERWISYLRKN